MAKFFQMNEGLVDRAMRIVLGMALISQVFAGLHTPWAWIGLIPLGTGIFGTCPLYSMFGLNTCPLPVLR